MSKKSIFTIVICLALVFTLAVPAGAWLAEQLQVVFPKLTGSTNVSYFESGDGSPEKPYVISNPIHLYNLAWLQYIGYFNLGDVNNGRMQNYFKLSDNMTELDMSGLALPPIGTTEYPFLGHFDGNGKTITNLVTGNADELLVKRPTSAKFNVNALLSQFDGASSEAGAVIGFFGVVGDHDNAVAELNARKSALEADGKSVTGSYTGSEIAVKDTGLSNYTLRDYSSATTAGLVAGFVASAGTESPISGMQVNGRLTIEQSTATGHLSSNLSEFSLIGGCIDTYCDILQDVLVTVTDPRIIDDGTHAKQNTAGSDGQGWGGSIAMEALYNTVDALYPTPVNNNYVYLEDRVTSATGVDTVINTTTHSTYQYGRENDDQLSVVYTRYTANGDTSDYYYLSGGKKVTKTVFSYGEEVTAYTIASEGNYLSVTDGNITNSTSADAAAKWILNSSGHLYTDIGGISYYLNATDNSTLSLSVTASIQWTMSSNDTGFYYTFGGKDYYLQFSDNTWTVRSPGSGWRISTTVGNTTHYLSASSTTLTDVTNANEATLWDVSGNHSGTISTIINNQIYYLYLQRRYGSWYTLTVSTTSVTWENVDGALRDSNYDRYLDYDNGWTTVNNANQASTLDFTAVSVTINDLTVGTTTSQSIATSTLPMTMEFDETNSTYIPLQLDENYNTKDSNTGYITSGTWDTTSSQTYPIRSGDIRVSRYSTTDIGDHNNVYVINKATGNFVTMTVNSDGTANGLEKYADCKQSYIDLLNGNNLYGLHFMSGLIRKDVLVNIPHAVINGDTYTNYKVPSDCIDFQTKERGYINFFAGTYFDGNDCFFSLHKIDRDATGNIQSINRIEAIYGSSDPLKPYVYDLDDGTAFTIPDGYNLLFDTNWLEHPNDIRDNRGYYFEVPVDPGEFALGSVDGGTGAYLLYLDISANAQIIDRTIVTEVITETTNTYTFAEGVQVMGTAYDPAENDTEQLAMTLKSGFTGSIELSKADDIIIATAADTDWTVRAAGGVTVDEKTPTPDESVTTVTKRVTYIDTNLNTGNITRTVITYVQVGDDGTPTVTAVDGSGTDVTATVVGTTANDKTSLTTTKKGDAIDWSTITGVAPVLEYRYQTVAKNKITVTNACVYDETAKAYTVTVTTTQTLEVRIETVTTTTNVASSTLNGIATAEDATITVAP